MTMNAAQFENLVYTAPNRIEGVGPDGTRFGVSPEESPILWGLIAPVAAPYTPPPPPPYEERLRAWRKSATGMMFDLQVQVIEQGFWDRAEEISSFDPRWLVVWRSGGAMPVTLAGELTRKFCEQLIGEGWQDWMEALPIWQQERPAE